MKRASKLGTALLLALCACEDGFLVIRTGVFAGSGFCSAMINDANWNCSQSSGQISGGGILIIFGTGRDPFGRQVDLNLTMHSTVGSAGQQIGTDDVVSAEVTVTDYGRSQTWTAGGSQGSGTLAITSLSAEQVDGTFDFVALSGSSMLRNDTYRVARGTFSVPLR